MNKKVLVGLLLATTIFIFYYLTLSPGINWGDSAKYVLLSKTLTLHINAGYHLLRTLLGYPLNFVPIGNLAWKHNLLSAFFGALTIFILFLITARLTGNNFCALGASIALAVSHNFWHLSVISESYTVYAFFLSLIIYIAIQLFYTRNTFYAYFLFFLAGLGLSAHLLILFSIIPITLFILYYVLRHIKPNPIKFFCCSLLFFLIGYLPIILVAIIKFHDIGLKGIIYEILDIRHSHFLFYHYPVKYLLKNYLIHTGLFFYQFSIAVIILFIGIIYSFKSDKFIFFFLALIILTNVGFIFLYVIPKSPYMNTGIYLVSSIFIAYGLKQLVKRFNFSRATKFTICVLLIGVPILTYYFSYELVKTKGLSISRQVPYRDNARYFLVPWKFNEHSAEKFAKGVFKLVEVKNNGILSKDKSAIIISDFTASIVLEYYQGEYFKATKCRQTKFWQSQTRKLNIINIPRPNFDILKFINKNFFKKSIYLVGGAPEYKMKLLKKKYAIQNLGALYKVVAIRND